MSLGNNMFQGMIWSAVERVSIQVVQFALGVVLARLLTPEEYGVFAILMIFLVISQVFVDSGFSKALIQKKNRTEDDISTVFLFNIVISLLAYFILWVSAPLISDFYNLPELVLLLRILALSLITNAIFTITATLLTIELDFKSLTKINLAATVISGAVAIYLAYDGYGVWALVVQTLIRSVITGVFMWLITRWKPNWVFSKKSFKQLFAYGSRLLISSLLGTTFSQINSILIGKYIGARDLGYYSRGIQFSDVVFGIFNASITNILLPGLSPIQNQHERLKKHVRTFVKASSLITAPIFLGIAVMAEPIILVLLTDKWAMAIPIMQIFCVSRYLTVFSGISVNFLYVIGRTDLTLRQQYLNIAVRVILLLSALQYGIFYIALAELLTTIIHFFTNAYFPGKIIKYGAIKQLRDIAPTFIASILMAAFVFGIMSFVKTDLMKLFVAPIAGALVYWTIIRVLRLPEYFLIIDKIKGLSKK